MAGATTQREGPAERIFRPLESLPLGPIWPGVIVAVGLGASFVGWHAAAGVLDEFFPPSRAPLLAPDARLHLTIGILTGFLVAVSRYEALPFKRDLLSLQPLTHLSERELAALIETEGKPERRFLLLFMGAGVLLGIAMMPAASADPTFILRPDAHVAWVGLSNGLLFALIGRAVYLSSVNRRVRARVSREIKKIDLLDRRSLAPLARPGLRNAFFWAGGSSIASLLALDMHRTWPLFVIIAGTLLLATLALVGPVRGIHQKLREKKRSELARIRERIRLAKESTLELSGDRGEAAAQLPGLLAYESRIEGVSEWPFDTPTLVRFAALVLLVTGSWLGGAIVERLLTMALESGPG